MSLLHATHARNKKHEDYTVLTIFVNCRKTCGPVGAEKLLKKLDSGNLHGHSRWVVIGKPTGDQCAYDTKIYRNA